MSKHIGKQSMGFDTKPRIRSSGSIVGEVEGNGPIGKYFDTILQDDTWGEKSWERAERKMFEQAVRLAVNKAGFTPEGLDCLLGGDLLNQIISANFAARELRTPYLGLYGACSTMAESLMIGSMMIDGGYANRVACVAGSHFSTAERQYRLPLEMGGQSTPTSQRTVTGVGCLVLTDENDFDIFTDQRAFDKRICVTSATIGRVVDFGITDANNMGAAMAPAAFETLEAHFRDMGSTVKDYDLIITGDLGDFGTEMLKELCMDKGIDLGDKHVDCGNIIFEKSASIMCGASGCGCSAVTLGSYLLKRMEEGDFKKALFMATGALLSPSTTMQGDSIPSIAHAVVIERQD